MKLQLKGKEFIRRKDLAKLSGVRESTIKYYTELGLLPFKQDGERLSRYYNIKEALKTLKDITALKKQGKTIPEIVEKLSSV